MKDIREETEDLPQQIAGATNGSDLIEAEGHAAEWEDEIRQNGSAYSSGKKGSERGCPSQKARTHIVKLSERF